MKKNMILLMISLIAFGSCNRKFKKYPEADNYLIFGHFFGFCAGETCIEIFKLNEKSVSEDKLDQYPDRTNFYSGNYVVLSQQDFEDVKDLIHYFPNALLAEPSGVIGQPDVTDGGGLYIEYNYNGIRRFWLIDNIRSNVPAAYHPFMDKVVQKISLLQ